mgnify:CR=1 FL=1
MARALTVYIGEPKTVAITREESAGTALNIAGRTYTAMIRETPDATTELAEFSCSITGASTGELECTLTSGDTNSLTVLDAWWSLREDGVTLFEEPCQIRQPVTR